MQTLTSKKNHYPLITTFITTYKRPVMLKKAIESMLAQTFTDFQLIIYDNASGDDTHEIVRSFMETDPRIKYICHPKNVGMLANYENAFKKIDTTYFSFLSDDDLVSPWFLETALNDLKKYPSAAFCACSSIIVDENQNELLEPIKSWSREGFFENPEGIFEMLGSKQKYPVPNTVLFRTGFARHVIPLLTPEIQLVWDPTYFVQLASRFPIVINKTRCGTFLGHSNSHSANFFQTISQEPQKLDEYLLASQTMLQHSVLTNPFISEQEKMNAKNMYSFAVKQEFSNIVAANLNYIPTKQLIKSILSCYKKFGFDCKFPDLIMKKCLKQIRLLK